MTDGVGETARIMENAGNRILDGGILGALVILMGLAMYFIFRSMAKRLDATIDQMGKAQELHAEKLGNLIGQSNEVVKNNTIAITRFDSTVTSFEKKLDKLDTTIERRVEQVDRDRFARA